jgi:hypothetical protein
MQDDRRDREENGIKIVDKRKFTADGEVRPDVEDKVPAEEEEAQAEERSDQPERVEEDEPEQGFERRPLDEPQGVDFTMLINAMAAPAMMFLGEIPHPDGGEAKVELEQARLQIDMLDLLRVKCRGNLTSTEQKLLEQVLYQLRMSFVAKSGGA